MRINDYNKKSVVLSLLMIACGIYLCGCGKASDADKDTIVPVIENISDVDSYSDTEGTIDAETSENAEPVNNEVDDIEPEEEPSTDREISIIMVGDMLLHTRVYESGMLDSGEYSYEHLFTHTRSMIENADIAIVNEEVILGGTELGLSGYPAFNGPFEVADALYDTGFDVILQATNHALDKGSRGVLNDIAYWEEKYPSEHVIGIHDEAADLDRNYAVVEVDGISIAILNYTYGTNGISMPADMPYLVNMLNENQVAEDMAKAREEADYIIVCPHWGTEYIHTADGSQKKWAQFFADNGANLVIGTHPHVIEPIEYYGDCPVYYSIGNYVNATSGEGAGTADRMLGAMANITLTIEDDIIIETKCDQIPLVSHIDTSDRQRLTVYPLDEYNEELAKQNEICRQDSNFSIDYLWNVWNSVFGF